MKKKGPGQPPKGKDKLQTVSFRIHPQEWAAFEKLTKIEKKSKGKILREFVQKVTGISAGL